LKKNKEFSEKITQLFIQGKASLLEALKKMDELDVKLLLVKDTEKFFGLLSIGDIQRAIIKNKRLETEIRDILRTNITVATDKDSEEEIKAKMLLHRTECMPVLDENNNLVEVFFWEDIFSEKAKPAKAIDIPVVIMAGGFGTRLKPLTNIIPKALVPIGEKPIIEIIMDGFYKAGVRKFFVSLNYKGEMVKYYFEHLDNSKFEIEYVTEEKPMGTGGSISLLKGKIDKPFFVSNCDILIDQDYSDIYEYHAQNRNEITLVGSLKHYKIPYGILETGEEGVLTSMKEKPELTFLINSGMYILEPHLLEEIPENSFFHITELIDKVRERGGKVGVFPVSEKAWLDIGEWNEYQQTIKTFEKKFPKN
jgi:dTDP-glucose pyrophosphorylase